MSTLAEVHCKSGVGTEEEDINDELSVRAERAHSGFLRGERLKPLVEAVCEDDGLQDFVFFFMDGLFVLSSIGRLWRHVLIFW
jgi:hypothetical protein